MSRVGLRPIPLPATVVATLDGHNVSVVGPKGTLQLDLPSGISLEQTEGSLALSRKRDSKRQKSLHGLVRALIQNAVTGVTEGFSAKLEIHGVGYRLNLENNRLKLGLGFSQEISFILPEGIDGSIEQNVLTISGIDKQQVHQVASAIRSLKKPEPYKGKGIRFPDEYIIRKSGKAAATGKE